MLKRKLTISLLVLVLVVVFSLPALAVFEDLAVEELEDMVKATSNERESYDQYPTDWDFVLIDTRAEEEYNAGHINGAINMPADEILPWPLPEDQEKTLVFYGERPMESAMEVDMFGHTNIYTFEGGVSEWNDAGNYLTVTPEYVDSLVDGDYAGDEDTKPYLIIDTRGFGMYLDSHVPTAVNMEHTIFEDKYLDYMSKNEDMLYITYCGGFFWGHSHAVARTLASEGYGNVKVMAGGTPAWEGAGKPLFGMDASDIEADADEDGIVSIDATRFNELWEDGAVVVDVRTDSEVAGGMLSDAVHIDSNDISADVEAAAEALPEDKSTPLLIHCAAGVRAHGAAEALLDYGYENVYYLDGRANIDADGNLIE